MFPNPQDVLPLPPRPDLEQYGKHATELLEAWKPGASDAIRGWASRWAGETGTIEAFARETLAHCDDALPAAQFVIARIHGFANWPAFAAHVDGLATDGSPVSRFEAAAEAIIIGDAAALRRLLREDATLVRARSTREHRAMLLHYVAANGVENYRQTTPANAVEMARILLDAGAEVDAEADMYGGACTTLGLAATSIHPENAGVQNVLMQLLIDRGAEIDRPGAMGRSRSFVVGCLANGRGPAAEYLAAHGARLDLEGAAGIGRLDVVMTFVGPDGTLTEATIEQMRAGFAWACEFGRTAVVECLLDRGMPIDSALRPGGETGLHWASFGGHGAIVSLLLARLAPVDTVENTYGGTPLTWALHGWDNARAGHADGYYEVVERLVRAGAQVNPAWFEDRADHTPFGQRIRADGRMLAALGAGAGRHGTNETD